MDFLHSSKKWIWPLAAFLILAPFTPWVDLSLAHFFFKFSNDHIARFMKNPLLDFLFDWGPMPANLLALASAAALICSYLVPRLKKWRNPCLVLLLAYVIGAGVITNGILKEYWGRPRPKQVEQFGGTQAFRPFFLPDFTNPLPSKSFPCGHCSLGFYFFALFLVGKRLRKPWLWKIGLTLALLLGIALSLSRMAQGGHFFSDTLFSALLMWYTALAIDWLVYSGEDFP
jgi:membrane-associated PAP2 superfamily phosphatase